MIRPLRKTHRRVSLFIAIALPLFFFAGIVARHKPLGRAVAHSGSKP